MEKLLVSGGKSLSGAVRLAGAKNSINKLLIASLLSDEPLLLSNVPEIGETDIVVELCRNIGSRVERRGGSLSIHTPEIKNTRVKELSRKNRIPVLALGPLLARVGEAEMPSLGGDYLGPRPIDIHIAALGKLGVVIEETGQLLQATTDGLHGGNIVLRYPSVGATENSILASVLARGNSVIQNAAIEPEIIDMIKMLQKMGAIIELGSNRVIFVEGVTKLHGARHRVMPDRNEAASFAAIAVATGGEIIVEDARQDDLLTFLNSIRRIGGEYEVSPSGIKFFKKDKLKSLHIETDTHPGFMTDWQQPFAALLTQAEGKSIIHETVYEDRFGYIQDLKGMGGDINVSHQCLGALPCRFQGKGYNHSCLIRGKTPLHGAKLEMRDIRAGMTHIIASLIAEGTSEITGLEHIDRGYEKIDQRIKALGADIKRVDD